MALSVPGLLGREPMAERPKDVGRASEKTHSLVSVFLSCPPPWRTVGLLPPHCSGEGGASVLEPSGRRATMPMCTSQSRPGLPSARARPAEVRGPCSSGPRVWPIIPVARLDPPGPRALHLRETGLIGLGDCLQRGNQGEKLQAEPVPHQTLIQPTCPETLIVHLSRHRGGWGGGGLGCP